MAKTACSMENSRDCAHAGVSDLYAHPSNQYCEKGERYPANIERLFETVLDAIPDIIGIQDTNHRIIRYNSAGYRFLNKPPEEVHGRCCYELIGRRSPCIPCASARVLKTKKAAGFEKYFPELGVWLDCRAYPVFDDDGAVVVVIEHLRDITEHKRDAEALRVSQGKLSAMLSSLTAHVSMMDKDLNIIWANNTAREMFGEKLIGKKCYQAYHGRQTPCVPYPCLTLKAFEDECSHTHETQVIDKDGQVRYFDCTANVALRDKNGNSTAVIEISQDITERKRAEEEKLDLERQLRHAQKLESLGIMAAGIAHDFNNILMAILGNADLALAELSSVAPVRGKLHKIVKASKRAAELAKQMLAYSGKDRYIVEPINASEFIQEVTDLLDVSISKNVVLKYNLAENLPAFDGDVTQIRQVIMNLITNASEAIGDKSGVITLSTGVMDCDRAYLNNINEVLLAGLDEPLPEGVYTYLQVTDTGCGMDAETIEKIFDPFFTTKFTGRGLGMSAVLGIVRGHKGGLKIRSKVDRGTTFKVFFPANKLPKNGSETH